MLLALGLLAFLGLWWLGRSGGRWPRLPPGLSGRGLAGYAAFAAAALLALRGSLLPSLLLAGFGVWLTEGGAGLGRRFGHAFAGWKRPGRRVRTALIELDRSTDGVPGDGLILAGPRAGQRLSTVPMADLLALWQAGRGADPEGARLLEGYLDRRHPGWRVDAERDAHPGPGRPLQPGAMTEEEAYQVLGLERGAPLEQVRAAHRSLMKRLHPDQGGANERAARVNAARDRLTDRHR